MDSIELEVFVNDQLVQGSAFAVPYYCTPEQYALVLSFHKVAAGPDVLMCLIFGVMRHVAGWKKNSATS